MCYLRNLGGQIVLLKHHVKSEDSVPHLSPHIRVQVDSRNRRFFYTFRRYASRKTLALLWLEQKSPETPDICDLVADRCNGILEALHDIRDSRPALQIDLHLVTDVKVKSANAVLIDLVA